MYPAGISIGCNDTTGMVTLVLHTGKGDMYESEFSPEDARSIAAALIVSAEQQETKPKVQN